MKDIPNDAKIIFQISAQDLYSATERAIRRAIREGERYGRIKLKSEIREKKLKSNNNG